MVEVGNMGLPPKVLRKGITDMVRISDARTSGGTVVLHTSPEAAAGGPLAAVQNGDMIELDVPNRRFRHQRRRIGTAPEKLDKRCSGSRKRLCLVVLQVGDWCRSRGRFPLPRRPSRQGNSERQSLTVAGIRGCSQ